MAEGKDKLTLMAQVTAQKEEWRAQITAQIKYCRAQETAQTK